MVYSPVELDLHLVVHSDERPYACTWPGCTEVFKRQSVLSSHVKYHTATKKHACSYCAYTCVERGDLVKHERIHTNEKPFVCDECGAAYAQKTNLNGHVRRAHGTKAISYVKKREEEVVRLLDAEGIPYRREVVVSYSSIERAGWARLDFIIWPKDETKTMVLEVDEHQHTAYPVGYDPERLARVARVRVAAGETKPLVVVRYNPDAYRVDGMRRALHAPKRREALVRTLRTLRDAPTEGALSVHYLFYTTEQGRLAVLDHPEFPKEMAELCHVH